MSDPSRKSRADRRLDRKFRKRELARQDLAESLHLKNDLNTDRSLIMGRRVSAIKTAARFGLVSIPVLAPMVVAWTGQAGFAMKIIGWDLPAAILYAAAYELTTTFCAWMYHEARSDGDGGFEYRAATWAFALGSATQQWWHYSTDWHATPRSVTFASMTIIGLIVWELYARLMHRRTLRKLGLRSEVMPKIDLVRWIRFPKHAWRAWSHMIRTGERDIECAWVAADSARFGRSSAPVRPGSGWVRSKFGNGSGKVRPGSASGNAGSAGTSEGSGSQNGGQASGDMGAVVEMIDPRDGQVRHITALWGNVQTEGTRILRYPTNTGVKAWAESLQRDGVQPKFVAVREFGQDEQHSSDAVQERIELAVAQGHRVLNHPYWQEHMKDFAPVVVEEIPTDRGERMAEVIEWFRERGGLKDSVALREIETRYGLSRTSASELRRDAHKKMEQEDGGNVVDLRAI